MGRIIFEGLDNTRDLGGIRTMDGHYIKEGLLIRSGRLGTASKTDEEWIRNHVSTVIDFRSPREMEEQPDPELSPVQIRCIPIIANMAAGVTRDAASDEEAFFMLTADPDGARKYMCRTYEYFVASETALSGYRTFVRMLSEDREKALLWHCTAGKDRAGIASVIVLEILGADRETIRADYLETNRYISGNVSKMIGMLEKYAGGKIPVKEEALRYMFEAREEFLDAAYRKVEECFGRFPSFLQDGLHLDKKDIRMIRERYLISS